MNCAEERYLLHDGDPYTNSYTLTVTGDSSAPPQVLATATTPGIFPTASPSGTPLKFASVSAGSNHTCAVTTGGAAYCWGWDFNGQLGNGSTGDDQLNPVAISGRLTFASVTAGISHTCGITTAGAAYCWGIGDRGRLGNGFTDR